MNQSQGVNLEVLVARLAEAGDDFEELPLGENTSIVVSARTARVYGPFFDGRDPIGWVPRAFDDANSFKALQGSSGWNLGGERLWLSPELEYFVANRRDFWNTYAVPPAIDPGAYQLSRIEGACRLSTAFNLRSARSGGHQAIQIERRIGPEPLSEDLPRTVRAACYREEIIVDSMAGHPPVVPWIIRQVALGGEVRIPARAGVSAGAIVGPLPEQARVARHDGFVFEPNEGRLFKAAFPARNVSPAMAYVLAGEREACAVVLAFDGRDDGDYFEEPPDRPGENGYSAFVFHDDGRFGGYAELEVVGLPAGQAGNRFKRAALRLTTTAWLGSLADVMQSIRAILAKSARTW